MKLDNAVGSCDQEHPIILLAHQPKAAKMALDSKYNIQLVIGGSYCIYPHPYPRVGILIAGFFSVVGILLAVAKSGVDLNRESWPQGGDWPHV